MRITAIVPAYNEEKTIASVVEVLMATQEINRVVVVDDGSLDKTGVIASRLGATVVTLPVNLGKGGALLAGVRATTDDYVMFIDADLIGLCPSHIRALLGPILTGQAEATVGVFSKGRLATDWAQRIAPGLSGQRVMQTSLFQNAEGMEDSGFGVEVALNRLLAQRHVNWTVVQLASLSQVMKEEKLGFWKGLYARIRMYKEIIAYFIK